MYTQCTHCKAIFRVTMKELTTAQGLLRCGECNNTFDAMESLSSTLHTENTYKGKAAQPNTSTEKGSDLTGSQTTKTYSSAEDNAQKYILLAVVGLAFLLLFQVLYSYRDWLAHNPVTGSVTRTICETINCSITPKRAPENIKIISRNVYAHPNEAGALMIAASMRNKAPFDQPYPLIEVSFLNSLGDVVALKRFPPSTYLRNTEASQNIDRDSSEREQEAQERDSNSKKTLFSKNDTFNFKLKISDPGNDAVRFQFRFL